MKKRMFWTLGIIVGTLVIWAGAKTSRAGYESADYKVVESEGKFEIRDYPAMTTVATSMQGTGSNGNSGFGKLFRYISGDNDGEQKIAMTTPVFIESNPKQTSMMFVVPAKVAAEGAPEPKSNSVEIRKISGGRFAALRFKGQRSDEKQHAALADLRKLVEERGLKTTGEPVYAYYDPPWTPGFMRRNEVLLRLAD